MVIPAILESPHYRLTAVASRQESKAKEFAGRFKTEAITGYQELLDRPDIEVIYMPLPTSLHLEWAVKSVRAGKHVLIEKSLAGSYADALAIVEAARENNRVVRENFMFAFHRQFRIIREIIAAGRLGAVRNIRSSFGFPPFPDEKNIRYQKELEGGALLDAGAYTVKIAQLLMGKKVTLAASSMTFDKAKQVDIHGSLYLTDDQAIGFQGAYGFDNFYQCNLEIWGSKGKLSAYRIFTAGPGVAPVIRIETAEGAEEVNIEPDNHFLNLLEDFYQTIQSGHFELEYEAVLNQAKLLQEVRDQSVKAFY